VQNIPFLEKIASQMAKRCTAAIFAQNSEFTQKRRENALRV